jgi:ABC-type transport system involved in cytochrome bd biosynthesis fused ATPase/permease subunit
LSRGQARRLVVARASLATAMVYLFMRMNK